MTKTKKIIAILVVLAMVFSFVFAIAACTQPHKCSDVCETCGGCLNPDCEEDACQPKCQGHGSEETHTCQHVCETCGKCTDSTCTNAACAQKCPGHQQQGGSHECKDACDECGKCTTACAEPECADKCQGHGGSETCEHANIVLNKCEDCKKVFTVDEILAALDALGTSAIQSLPGTYQLSGIVTTVTPDGSNTNIWFTVEGASESRVLEAYRIANGDDTQVSDIVVGARVTVTGTLKAYYKTQEFDSGCKLAALSFPEYTITANNPENATVSEIAATAVAGAKISFTVTASEGYKIASVEVNDVEIEEDGGSYSFVVTGNMKVVITIVSNDTKTYDPVTFDSTKQGYTNAQDISTVTVGEGDEQVTITFDKGTGSNGPKYYTSGTSIRAYGGNTITFNAPSGLKLTKIVITFASGEGSNEITSDVGTWASPTWSGSADTVVLTIGGTSGHRRIQAITITFGE